MPTAEAIEAVAIAMYESAVRSMDERHKNRYHSWRYITRQERDEWRDIAREMLQEPYTQEKPDARQDPA